MERFSFIFLAAGVACFVFAFAVSAVLPMLPVKDMHVQTIAELAENVPVDFEELAEQYPDAFQKAFGSTQADSETFAKALVRGHKVYVSEACWHCHSQQVRPWGNDEARFGRVAYPEEYHNELNMPPLWGTRRVGPDLSRAAGKQSNDWHVAHFYRPVDVVPWSVMPAYPWFYEKDGKTPNRDGLSIITYVQWLGSWHKTVPESFFHLEEIEDGYEAPAVPKPIIQEPVVEEDVADEDY